jgi:glycosyltransferase involved in cell wall biosynthesis
MITYKHEAFIAQAIEGVLMQEVKYPIELINADDCSPDKTKFVVESFKKHKNYNWIKYTRHQTNKGMVPNFKWTLQQSKSKYSALCEGDDYWTDPYKLQKQVDFLEANEGYVLCFHEVNILEPDREFVRDYITNVPEGYETINVMAEKGNYIHTASVVFRNIIHQWPNEFYHSPLGDYFIYILLGQYGKYHCINEKMSVYRNGVGIWSTQHAYEKTWNFFKALLAIRQANIKNYFVSEILSERIKRLFSKIINDLDIVRLGDIRNIAFMSLAIDVLFLEKIKENHTERVANISSMKLLKIIIYRLYRKIRF